MFTTTAYHPPSYLLQPGGVLAHLIPSLKINLGRTPTPIHKIELPGVTNDCWIKRDDLTSFDLSGNKVRKLEFLMQEAIYNKHDSVITIGGVQSNHARATALAAKQLGLEAHLILRTAKGSQDNLDLTGNLLFDRIIGSKIYTISPSTYAQIGSNALCEELEKKLRDEGKNPYVIPVGGSNMIGAFGYIDCINEIVESEQKFDHIVFACGSGGTLAGLAIGAKLAGIKSEIHGVGVCDNSEYFYRHLEEVVAQMGIDTAKFGSPRTWCRLYEGQGVGYARSTSEELQYIIDLASKTGIILDPVYSGKAMYYLVHNLLNKQKDVFRPDHKILFIHTGGVFGLYDKSSQILPLLPTNQVEKLLDYTREG